MRQFGGGVASASLSELTPDVHAPNACANGVGSEALTWSPNVWVQIPIATKRIAMQSPMRIEK
jgi:hypothetical protein